MKSLLLLDMWGSSGLPQWGACPSYLCVLEGCVFNFCWCSVYKGNLRQGCCSPGGYTVIFLGETVGIPLP